LKLFVSSCALHGVAQPQEPFEKSSSGTQQGTKEREMKKLFSTRKRIAIVAAVAVVALTGVAAFAYFVTQGSGTGAAKVGTDTPWTVTSDAYAGGPLTPGGGLATHESVKYKVNNPSTGQQSFTNVNIKIADSSGNPWSVSGGTDPNCTAADFQLSLDNSTWASAGASVNDTALAANVAPLSSTGQSTVYLRMIDTGASQNNCRSADVPLYFYVS
jgi:hypothetical protein